MAVTGYAKRRVNPFTLSLTISTGAGDYENVFEALEENTPFDFTGAFGRIIRVSFVKKNKNIWLLELYLMIKNLEILEITANPDEPQLSNFATPQEERSFATRACGIFDLSKKIGLIEYVRNGPKRADFEDLLSAQAYQLRKRADAHFSLSQVIDENFISEIESFERIRQVKVVFNRPNPGWGDISILADELEGSEDAKRELTLSAPRAAGLSKDEGIVGFIKRKIIDGDSPMSDVVISGKREGDAAETQISSSKSGVKHIVSLPITDDEDLYRDQFLKKGRPFIS